MPASMKTEKEQATPLERCFNCKGKQHILVKVLESGAKTQNFIGSCQNKECFRYTDESMLETWVRVPDTETVRREVANINRIAEKNTHELKPSNNNREIGEGPGTESIAEWHGRRQFQRSNNTPPQRQEYRGASGNDRLAQRSSFRDNGRERRKVFEKRPTRAGRWENDDEELG